MVVFNRNSVPRSTHNRDYISPFNVGSFIGSNNLIPQENKEIIHNPSIPNLASIDELIESIKMDIVSAKLKAKCPPPQEHPCGCKKGCYDMSVVLHLPVDLFAEQNGPIGFYVGATPNTILNGQDWVPASGSIIQNTDSSYQILFDITRQGNLFGVVGDYTITADIRVSCDQKVTAGSSRAPWSIVGEFHVLLPRDISDRAASELAEIEAIRAFLGQPSSNSPSTYEWHCRLKWTDTTDIFVGDTALDVSCSQLLGTRLSTDYNRDNIEFYDATNQFAPLYNGIYFNRFGNEFPQDVLNSPSDGIGIEVSPQLIPSSFNIKHGCWSWVPVLDENITSSIDGITDLTDIQFSIDGSNDPYAPFDTINSFMDTLGGTLINNIGVTVYMYPLNQDISEWTLENYFDGIQLSIPSDDLNDNETTTIYSIPFTLGSQIGGWSYWSKTYYYDDPNSNLLATINRELRSFDWINLTMENAFLPSGVVALKHKDGWQEIAGTCDTFGIFEYADRIETSETNICQYSRWRYRVFKLDRLNKEFVDITDMVLEDDIERVDDNGSIGGDSGNGSGCPGGSPNFLNLDTLQPHFGSTPSPSPI